MQGAACNVRRNTDKTEQMGEGGGDETVKGGALTR